MEPENQTRIIPVNIEKEMKTSFISYAMAVIINRALPDVRDGLKPVHRRILYAMNELGLTPDKPFRKCARIVGDVLGKYHPHGDSSVYDALVRLAQDFSTRYMLAEGHGNFGSVDGDEAAAMRYTEARMSKITMEMLADIDKDTVDFMPNFDESLMQPTVLPSRLPNLLINGSGGIAVGMATNIPPHNVGEVIDGVVALIDNPDLTPDELMRHIVGPDFPTGGIILGTQGIREAYRTGRGRVIVRARTMIETYANGRDRIIVTELPYQVNKARLVEKIAEMVKDKRVEGISDLREESDREGMRIVIELKKDVSAQVVLNTLYKHTQMQDTFGVIMLALVDGHPRVLNLRDMLHYYILHQQDVVTRRSKFELERARARAHIVEGLLIALDRIDEVIRLIRSSRTGAEAKQGLIERFGLSEKQAQAILDMRLQRLTGLEREKLEAEFAQLQATIEYLLSILGDELKLMGVIKDEILALRAKYADDRRTEIAPMEGEIDLEDLIEERNVVITRSHLGYIKRAPEDTYRAQNRGGRGIAGMSTRDEDFVEDMFTTSTHQHIMFFTDRGRVFRLKGYEIPESGRTARGMAMVNLLQLSGGEKVTAAFPVPHGDEQRYLLLATKQGFVKKTPLEDFDNIRKVGLIAISLREEDALIGVALTDGNSEVLLATRRGLAIRFHEDNIRSMGRVAMGVIGIRLDAEDECVDMAVGVPGSDVLVITERGFGKRTDLGEYRVQNRGGRGLKTLQVTQRTGLLAGVKMVGDEHDIMLITNEGVIIRTWAADIKSQGRNTQGVTLMRLQEDTKVVSVTLIQHQEPEEEADEDAVLDADQTVDTDAVAEGELVETAPVGADDPQIAKLLEAAEADAAQVADEDTDEE